MTDKLHDLASTCSTSSTDAHPSSSLHSDDNKSLYLSSSSKRRHSKKTDGLSTTKSHTISKKSNASAAIKLKSSQTIASSLPLLLSQTTTAPDTSTFTCAPSSIQFNSLSDQLILIIFRYLNNGKDIVRLTGVCKRFRALIDKHRDQLEKIDQQLIFRYNERGCEYPGYTVTSYRSRDRRPIDIRDASQCRAIFAWLKHINTTSIRFDYNMNCYIHCYGDGMRDEFLDFITDHRHYFLRKVKKIKFDKVKMLQLSPRSLSAFLLACADTLTKLRFTEVTVSRTDLIDARTIVSLPHLVDLIIYEPRPKYTLPSYPADPYADIGDEIFNIFNSLEYRQCSFIRLRLNYCGQITVNGFCSLIERWINGPVFMASVHIRNSPLLSRSIFLDECSKRNLIPDRLKVSDDDASALPSSTNDSDFIFRHKIDADLTCSAFVDQNVVGSEPQTFYFSHGETDMMDDDSDDSYVSDSTQSISDSEDPSYDITDDIDEVEEFVTVTTDNRC